MTNKPGQTSQRTKKLRGFCVSLPVLVGESQETPVFEPACSERDIVVTMTVWCYVHSWVHMCVHLSEFARTTTRTIVEGFQNNLTQFFSITCRCAT